MTPAPLAWNVGMAAGGVGLLALLATVFVAAIAQGPCSGLCLDGMLWVFVLALWGLALVLGVVAAAAAGRFASGTRR